MRCRAVQRLIVAYQDQELAPGEATHVAEHLSGCAACNQLHDRLLAVTPKAPADLAPSELPDWSKMDAALQEAWQEQPVPTPANRPLGRTLTRNRLVMGAYGLALGVAIAWGLGNAMRVQVLEDELIAATQAPPIETLLPASAMQPASFKPSPDDGKPH